MDEDTSLEPQTQPNPPLPEASLDAVALGDTSEGKIKKLPKFLIPLIILALLVGGYFAFAKYQNLWPFKIAISPSPAATPDKIASWKTYRNEEFGFEVRYPNKLNLEIFPSGLSFAVRKTDENPNDIHLPISVFDLSIIPNGNLEKLTIKSWVQKNIKDSVVSNIEEVTVHNQEGVKFIEAGELSNPIIYLSRNDDVYKIYFSFNYLSSENSEDLNNFNQILSTFKFNEPASDTRNWKTYKNYTYGYEIKYPENLIIDEAKKEDVIFRVSGGIANIYIKSHINKNSESLKIFSSKNYRLYNDSTIIKKEYSIDSKLIISFSHPDLPGTTYFIQENLNTFKSPFIFEVWAILGVENNEQFISNFKFIPFQVHGFLNTNYDKNF